MKTNFITEKQWEVNTLLGPVGWALSNCHQQMFPNSDSLTGCSVPCPNLHCRFKPNNTGLHARTHWRQTPPGFPEALGSSSCALPLFSWHAASPSPLSFLAPGQALRSAFHLISCLCYADRVCCAMSLKLCPALCDLVVCSLPVSSVHGLLQARILEWVTMPSSRGSSRARDQIYISYVSCIGRWVLYH